MSTSFKIENIVFAPLNKDLFFFKGLPVCYCFIHQKRCTLGVCDIFSHISATMRKQLLMLFKCWRKWRGRTDEMYLSLRRGFYYRVLPLHCGVPRIRPANKQTQYSVLLSKYLKHLLIPSSSFFICSVFLLPSFSPRLFLCTSRFFFFFFTIGSFFLFLFIQ